MVRKTKIKEDDKKSEDIEVSKIFDLLRGSQNSEENFKKTDKEIKKEKQKIVKILCKIDENLLKICDSLIENVAFMSVILRDLIQTVKKNGVKEFYMNGSTQCGFKKSVEIDLYNAMQKNFQSSMKLLIDLLSSKDSLDDEAKDELKKFLMQPRD